MKNVTNDLVFLIRYKYRNTQTNLRIEKPSDPEKPGLDSDKCSDVREWESLIIHSELLIDN